MMDTPRYPIGIQTFETLRNERCVYADNPQPGSIYIVKQGGKVTKTAIR